MKITKRDYFAGLAMHSFILGGRFSHNEMIGDLTKNAYVIADAMMAMNDMDFGEPVDMLWKAWRYSETGGRLSIGEYDSTLEDDLKELERRREMDGKWE